MKKILNNTNLNLFSNLLNQFLGIGFPILIQFYTIRHFRINDLGFLNLINSYWAIFTLGLSFFSFYLLKLFTVKNELHDLRVYLTNSLVLMYLFILLPFVVLLIFLYYKYQPIFYITALTSLPVITSPLSFEIFFQATLKNSFILIRRFIVRILFVLLLLTLAKTKSDFFIYICIYSLSTTLENIINFFYIKKYISVKLINRNVLKDIFFKSSNYLIFNLTYNIMPNISIIFAASYISIEGVSIYSILIRIINLATSFITSAVMVLYPIKIKHSLENDQVAFKDNHFLKNTILISIAVCLGLILTQKIIFFLFLKNYHVNNMTLQFTLLSTFIIFHSIYNYLTFNFYFIKNKIYFITFVNIILVLIFLLEILLVKLNIFKYDFSIIYIIPYPIVLIILYFNIKHYNK